MAINNFMPFVKSFYVYLYLFISILKHTYKDINSIDWYMCIVLFSYQNEYEWDIIAYALISSKIQLA